jgi:hypothetical protein
MKDVLFIPRSDTDMKKIIGMKFPFCIFRNDMMVTITLSEKPQETAEATIIIIWRLEIVMMREICAHDEQGAQEERESGRCAQTECAGKGCTASIRIIRTGDFNCMAHFENPATFFCKSCQVSSLKPRLAFRKNGKHLHLCIV